MANRQQASWRPAIRRFLDYVEGNSVLEIIHPGDSVVPRHTRPFMPIDQIQNYLCRNKHFELLSILKDLSLQFDVYPKDVLRRYTAVFCTLLQCGHGEYIELFRHKPNLSDNHLPFSIEKPPPGFPHSPEERTLLADFCKEQWRFCVSVIEDFDSDKHYEQEQVLPIVHKEWLAEGGTANLWLIKLHPTYNKIYPDSFLNPGTEESENYRNTFVLKEYFTSDAQSYYDNEVSAFRKIESNPNIIKYHGSFKRAGKFNLILEYADKKNLKDFLFHESPPSNPEHIIQLWDKLFQLIDALRGIHTVKPDEPIGPEIFQGWHQDVKPGNILILSKNAQHAHEWQFKLADLGISHFTPNTSTKSSTANDTFGTRSYGAPECFRPDLASFRTSIRVSSNVDIWSLGCVYSEFMRWMAHQYTGVQDYREERSEETKQVSRLLEGLDCFHNGVTVLESVHRSHKKAMDELRKKEFMIEPVIEMLESTVKMIHDMLLSSSDRPDARTLWNRKISIMKKAEAGLRKKAGGCCFSVDYQPPISQELLAHYPRPPDDGPPARPPILPPKYSQSQEGFSVPRVTSATFPEQLNTVKAQCPRKVTTVIESSVHTQNEITGSHSIAVSQVAPKNKIDGSPYPDPRTLVLLVYYDIFHGADTSSMKPNDLNTLVQSIFRACYKSRKDQTDKLTQEQVQITLLSILEMDGFNTAQASSSQISNDGKFKRKVEQVEDAIDKADLFHETVPVANLENGSEGARKRRKAAGYATLPGELRLALMTEGLVPTSMTGDCYQPIIMAKQKSSPYGFIASLETHLDPSLQQNFIQLCYINVRDGSWEFAQGNPNLKMLCESRGWVSSISKDYQDWWFEFAEAEVKKELSLINAQGDPLINELWPQIRSIRHMHLYPEFGVSVQNLSAVGDSITFFSSFLGQVYRAAPFHEGVKRLKSIEDYVARLEANKDREKLGARLEELFVLRSDFIERLYIDAGELKEWNKWSWKKSNFLLTKLHGMIHWKRQECLSQIASRHERMDFVERANHLKNLNAQILEATEELSLVESHQPIPDQIVEPFRKWVNEQLSLALKIGFKAANQDNS